MTYIHLTTMREEAYHGPLALAIGNFDGVHIGHMALLNRLKDDVCALSEEFPDLATGVWCFAEPPSRFLPGGPVPQLMTLEDKLQRFAEAGIEWCVLGDFSALRDYSPQRFVDEVLMDACNCRHIVCGYNFSFGARGQGTAKTLEELFCGHCSVVNQVCVGDMTVSSTAIRAAIASGEMERAQEMLGRPWSICLPVLHGKALGRTIGLPTLNQKFPEGHVLPAFGVYITRCTVDGLDYPAVTNVGVRPTVDDGDAVTCETHVLGLRADLYGRPVQIRFYARLRGEEKFSSLEVLRATVARDIESTRAYFGLC